MSNICPKHGLPTGTAGTCYECRVGPLTTPDISIPSVWNVGLNLRNLQRDYGAWADRNYGATMRQLDHPTYYLQLTETTLGVCEEAGELAHAILKMTQGIRGTREKHIADAQDAIGDIFNYMMHLCNRMGWDIEEIIQRVSAEVMQRDLVKYPDTGGVPPHE